MDRQTSSKTKHAIHSHMQYIDNIPRESGQFNVKLTVIKRWKNIPSLTPLKIKS